MIEKWITKLPAAGELVKKPMKTPSMSFDIYYFKTICDLEKIERLLIYPLGVWQKPQDYLSSVCQKSSIESENELYSLLIIGKAIILHESEIYLFEANKTANDVPGKAEMETTIQGPQSSLSEDAKANVNLIRHRYPSDGFRMESFKIGSISQTEMIMIFDAFIAKPQVLSELKQKINRIEAAIIQSTGQLEKLLNDRKNSIFPTMMLTERPDRIALNLSQGKVVILMDGTPFALILPTVFYDFLSAMDDLYLPFWVSKGLVLLRYIALFMAITLPSIYISVISFNPEFFRVQMTLSMAGSRAAVPYPSYVEVLFMLFMAEALTEASIRLPRFMAGTATTVGGLILGQAAQQAGLVSSVMIITIAAVTISNFVFPINTMSFSIRVIRYPLVLLSSLFGLVGVIVGLFLLTYYLVSLENFGQPYLKISFREFKQSFSRKGDKRS